MQVSLSENNKLEKKKLFRYLIRHRLRVHLHGLIRTSKHGSKESGFADFFLKLSKTIFSRVFLHYVLNNRG